MIDASLEEIIERVAKKAVAEYGIHHVCHFSEIERAMVHSQHETMLEEGADAGTIRVLFQWGVTVKDITKQVRRSFLWVLAVLVLAFGSKIAFKW